MNLLLVVDFQKEFINEQTKSSLEDIKNLVNSHKYDKVLFTKFINNENNPNYKIGWYGCMDEESRKVCMDTTGYDVLEKETYTAYNDELIQYIKDNNINNIYICGMDVECCVLGTAFNLFEHGYNTYVLKDYSYSCIGEREKRNAMEIIERCIGSDYVI